MQAPILPGKEICTMSGTGLFFIVIGAAVVTSKLFQVIDMIESG